MEIQKHVKPRNKLLKFASAVYFSSASYSPKHNNNKHHGGNRVLGFSGPLNPDQARRNPRKADSFDEAEPTSPKVSCMGQIKQKKEQRCESKKAKRAGNLLPPRDQKKKITTTSKKEANPNKQGFAFKRMFSGVNAKRKSDVAEDRKKLPDRAPSLSQMERFASGRGQSAFANFDWQVAQLQARVAPRHDDDNNLNYHSDDEEENNYGDRNEEREQTKIAFLAPLTIGGSSPGGDDVALQPRKEINLWKRRTMAPPSPLKV